MGILVYSHSSPLPSLNYSTRPHLSDFPLQQRRFSLACNHKNVAIKATTSGMANSSAVLQRITLENKYSEKLVGLLHETGSKEIVVLCHGFRSSKDSKSMTNLAVALEEEDISAFRFDFAGNGESEGTFEYGNYWREVDDLRAVIEHFVGKDRVITAILGHSKGGGVVLLYASKYRDVCTVVNVAGRSNLQKGVKERLGEEKLKRIDVDGFIEVTDKAGLQYRVTKESLMDRMNTKMDEACVLIDRKCRVLTVHGSEDKTVPVEDAFEFDKIIPNHKMHIIEGANHHFSAHQAELASAIVPFIKGGIRENTLSQET